MPKHANVWDDKLIRSAVERRRREIELARDMERCTSELATSISLTELAFLLGYKTKLVIYGWIKKGFLKPGVDYFRTPTGRYRIKLATVKKMLGIEGGEEGAIKQSGKDIRNKEDRKKG